MQHLLHLLNERRLAYDLCTQFKKDVKAGFKKINKNIPSQYLYDSNGCKLFNEITRHPDYYLTNDEIAILRNYKTQISSFIGTNSFNLIELGPGEGIKTQILIQEFIKNSLNFTYYPIDIAEKYLNDLSDSFQKQFRQLNITALHADYFVGLEWLTQNTTQRNVVLFLGSSIGNFNPKQIQIFIKHLWSSLQAGDYVLIGFDLCKNIETLISAYNDDSGITRDFNLNLLQRMNSELAANFDITQFAHYPTYNIKKQAMESYLISLSEQTVTLKALDMKIKFEHVEAIHVESSYKFKIKQIEQCALKNGFTIIQHFMDKHNHFVDTLWQVKK